MIATRNIFSAAAEPQGLAPVRGKSEDNASRHRQASKEASQLANAAAIFKNLGGKSASLTEQKETGRSTLSSATSAASAKKTNGGMKGSRDGPSNAIEDTKEVKSKKDEIIRLTEQLLAAATACDYDAYTRLMCPKFTYFGPDVRGTLVEGCDFHKFYFDQESRSHRKGSEAHKSKTSTSVDRDKKEKRHRRDFDGNYRRPLAF
uniref:CaMKII_AD domain-containing protein n=1 Tax=Mesocestoides corti TaxID=53468 RepID=A0A5K3EWH8_MESCO